MLNIYKHGVVAINLSNDPSLKPPPGLVSSHWTTETIEVV